MKLHVESTFDQDVWQQITQFTKITQITQALPQIIQDYIQIHVSFVNCCQTSATVNLCNIILKTKWNSSIYNLGVECVRSIRL